MTDFKSPYIGKKILELPYISEIFQTDKDALMYQDILKFSNDNNNFKRIELYNWLLRNNQELINYYQDDSTRNIPYSSRMANRKDRMDRIFNNLQFLKLIVCSGTKPATTLDKEVQVYSINKSGKILLAIIKIMGLKNELLDAEKKKDQIEIQMKKRELEFSYEDLHELIVSNLANGENAPYQSIMLKKFLTKLQSHKLFANFVNFIVSECISNNHIGSIPSLVDYVLHYMFDVAQDRNLYLDLWYESANELDHDVKEIFLYEIKLNIEQRFRNNVNGYSKEYEKQHFANRADNNKIVLEGECSSCKRFSIILLSHDGYRNWNRNNDVVGNSRTGSLRFDCKHCQSKHSCIIPTF